MSDNEMFKTTIMGGYDKDDVQEQFQRLKDDNSTKIAKLRKEMETKDVKIAELLKRLELKESQQERLEMEIREKYQKYIDNYDSIGRLVFEAQIRADEILKEAAKKSDAILASADAEALRRIQAVQTEIDDKLAEGKKKYVAVQEEMIEIVELINQAQKRFMSSYKEVHRIIRTMPTSLRDIEEVMEEGIPKTVKQTEVLLGNTQGKIGPDTVDDIEDLDEYDADEAINEKLASKVLGFLEEDLEYEKINR